MINVKTLIIAGLCTGITVSCDKVSAPAPILPVPTADHIEWHKRENYAFVHFGLNTFNDMEWGYGDTPSTTFNPTNLDCEQWVRVIKAAGLKAVILTAKHHDGFCLWPTETVEYSIKNSPYKNGKGDLVKELSDACHKYGLAFGLYLSPWDRQNAEYGREKYREDYHKQINELISNYGPLFEFWFDGANGGNGWYGGANETRSIDAKTYYRYGEAREMIKKKHPKAMIFGGTQPDLRWIGNENGWAGATNWSTYDYSKEKHHTDAQWGMKDGNKWLPGECDVSIRPGWFYHKSEDHHVKTVPQLVDLYYRSVGHNANFLLNFPVALTGQIHPIDSANAVDFYKAIQEELKTNLLAGIEPEASNERGRGFRADNVTDGDWDSYWATADSLTTGNLTFNLPKETMLNRIMIQEYIPLGQRVDGFKIETKENGKWSSIETNEELTTIGYKRLIRFRTVKADAIRISFLQSKGPLCINNVEAFLAPTLLEQPQIRRNEKDEVIIELTNKNTDIHYTTDGTEPNSASAKYEGPFVLKGKGKVKAIAYDSTSGKTGPVAEQTFDISAEEYKVISPKDDKTVTLFDGSVRSAYQFPEGKNEIVINLVKPHLMSGFVYSPSQKWRATGHISHYEFWIDGKKISAGEFSNIRNNPIEQIIRFAPVKGQRLVFKCVRIADNAPRGSIGEFSVITED